MVVSLSSYRSYKSRKKHLESFSSPPKSALINSTSDKGDITLEGKTTPPDNSPSNSNRLAVGGNITNNTSLSQLDML